MIPVGVVLINRLIYKEVMLFDSRKFIHSLVALPLCLSGLAMAQTQPQTFSVPQVWHVPGATLQPGSYSIRLVDHMSDRSIVTIDSTDGSVHTTFIAIPNPKLPGALKTGPVMWPGENGDKYVRAWKFQGSPATLEFAYPKADAVSISRREQSPVPAVDPDSEGMKAVPNATASKADMEVISLWLLSANRVGPDPNNAEIKAVRFQPGTSVPAPKHVAAVASTRLPNTASDMPLVLLIGLLALTLGAVTRFVRTP